MGEIVSIGLDQWGTSWMNRRSLAVALAQHTYSKYIVHPRYPAQPKNLLGLPRTRHLDGVHVLDPPSWMHPDFTTRRRCGWVTRSLMQCFFPRPGNARLRGLLIWHPSLVRYLDVIPADVTCCYIDDFFEGLGRSKNDRARIRDQQAELIDRVDVVFVTWRGLAKKLGIENQAVTLPHGVDFDHYSRAGRGEFSQPSDLPAGRPVAGYIGTINAKFDMDLVAKMSLRLSDWNIVLLGHVVLPDRNLRRRFDQLISSPNVFHLGVKTQDALGGYLQAFDVCTMCYQITDWMRYGLPMKMYQYFATGKPIVSTYLPSLDSYRSYMDVCTTHEEFIAAVERHHPDREHSGREERVAFAAENTWDHRARTILDKLAETHRLRQAAEV